MERMKKQEEGKEEQAQEEQQEDEHKHQQKEGKYKMYREDCQEQVFYNLLGLRLKKMEDSCLASGVVDLQSVLRKQDDLEV